MPRQRMTYTAEFKLQAVRMIADQHLSVVEVARRLDVGKNLLRAWAKAFRERGPDAFPGHGCPSPADDELRRLRAEVVRLRAERDLLKNTTTRFKGGVTRRSVVREFAATRRVSWSSGRLASPSGDGSPLAVPLELRPLGTREVPLP